HLPRTRLKLDPQVPDLALGSRLAVQLPRPHQPPSLSLATVTHAQAQTVAFEPMSVPSTVVTLAAPLGSSTSDRRKILVDSVVGAPFKVGPTWTAIDLLPTWLLWWGDTTHAKDLKG